MRAGAHGGVTAGSTAAPTPRRRDDGTAAAAPAGGRQAKAAATATAERPKPRPKLSKDAYRRRREVLDAELSRLGLRKSQLELAMGTPSVSANFVELRRVTSELADVERALGEAEDAWLELEEQAP